ncbi:2-amino-4-hydroxy-6-hydroxymethyldihydropteridine diphosphokinase, partial [Acidihalobacter prosperus]
AFDALDRLPQSNLDCHSRLYINPPMGPRDQPDYVNAVALIQTALPPLKLLEELQLVEAQQGRVRDGVRWGPRTLDLDLLLYGDKIIRDSRLIVPHPGMHERNFVLYPLAEIAPQLVIPKLGPLEELLADCSSAGLVPIKDQND